MNGSDKKIVVFDVGGVIALKSDLKIGANTTIAGQTAPAPGITVRYYTIRPDASNIIVRFIRFRRGQEKDVNDGADAIWTRHQTGQIYDHCSFSWSIDEIASFYDNNNFTMQWCTLAESLNNAGHGKGAHGYGGIWGGKLASFHHNLIAHVNNRSPRFNGARYDWTGYTSNKLYSQYKWANAVQSENVDFRNCVIYNCGNGCYGGPGGGRINIVNNYYKTGPAASTDRVTNISIGNSTSSSDNSKYWNMTSLYYIKGNQVNSNASRDWTGINYDSGVFTINGVEVAVGNPGYRYVLGSVLNQVLLHQSVIGVEAKIAMDKYGVKPDMIIGCAGGGSNLGGLIAPFMGEKLRGEADYQIIAVEPASCPSFTRGRFAYDFCDTGMVCPMAKMYTLGSGFIPAPNHAGGLRYHGMSSILSQLYHDGYMEARAVEQTKVFEAAEQFARVEGILPAPESSHAIRVAIDEALKCKETGEAKTILFGLTGTGYFDMVAYEKYHDGLMTDYIPTDADLEKGFAGIPKIDL